MVAATPLLITCSRDTDVSASLATAAALVSAGGLVAFPTETVYGIAVHAWDRAAIERLYHLKGRPEEKQLTLHLWDARQVEMFARDVSPVAQQLMSACWPGPLTIILPGRETPTVGLRLPDHAIAREFLRLCQVPVAAPSANRSGEPPATAAAQVVAAFDGALDAVIDAGPTTHARASTVVDATSSSVRILREGAISRARLQQLRIPIA